jgi:hypothetical protein
MVFFFRQQKGSDDESPPPLYMGQEGPNPIIVEA